jgi:hypothetical protein
MTTMPFDETEEAEPTSPTRKPLRGRGDGRLAATILVIVFAFPLALDAILSVFAIWGLLGAGPVAVFVAAVVGVGLSVLLPFGYFFKRAFPPPIYYGLWGILFAFDYVTSFAGAVWYGAMQRDLTKPIVVSNLHIGLDNLHLVLIWGIFALLVMVGCILFAQQAKIVWPPVSPGPTTAQRIRRLEKQVAAMKADNAKASSEPVAAQDSSRPEAPTPPPAPPDSGKPDTPTNRAPEARPSTPPPSSTNGQGAPSASPPPKGPTESPKTDGGEAREAREDPSTG